MKIKSILLVLILANIIFFSCSKEITVAIIMENNIDQAVKNNFISNLNKINSTIKIKEPGINKIYNKDIKIYLVSSVSENRFFLPSFPASETEPGNLNQTMEYRFIIDEKLYAPYTLFYDSALNASYNDIIENKYKIKPLDEIFLPEKAIAIEGLYPDDHNYPLKVKTEAIFVNYKNRSKKSEKIERIILSLEEIASENLIQEKITWLSFTGDIMPGRGVSRLLSSDNGLKKVFNDTLEILQKSDIAIGNLEGAVTNKSEKLEKSFNFKFDPSVLVYLKEAGFKYLYITNNHSFDYGEEGFIDTLLNFKKANIATSGAGENITEAIAPWQTEINKTKINIFSLADYPPEKVFSGRKETEAGEKKPGILWPSNAFFKMLESISKEETIDIVCIHGGFEWSNLPAENQVALYRKLVEYGADLVIGTHPHVLHPLEVKGTALIAYSLGNFIFPGMDEMEYGEETVILKTGFMGSNLKYINIYPVKISNRQVSLDKSGEIDQRFYKMNKSWNSK
ncbi:MAG: CapA family protein [Spirochaetaceae bacterium]|nr:CapA family protein [Spirochaetaceae bacterium]